MAIAVAMLMGLMLTTASSGLLVKQLMLRRQGAAESYKQLAEMAATSGMNRVLAAMNSTSTDRSYLWELEQINNYSDTESDDQNKQWEWTTADIKAKLKQPCQEIQDSGDAAIELLEGKIANGEGMRSDGSSNDIQVSYRLRSHEIGDDAHTLKVEGYATKDNGSKVLSRSLFSRVLSTEDIVAKDEHWGVIGAKTMDLGPSQIEGDGLAIWLIDKEDADAEFSFVKSCDTDLIAEATGSTNSGIKNSIWPKIGDGNQFPDIGLFANHNVHNRQLSININKANELPGTISRDPETENITKITLRNDDLCGGKQDKPCLAIIKDLILDDGVDLIIETREEGALTRPVILRLAESDTTIDLSTGRLCQADSKGSDTAKTLECNASANAEELIILNPITNEDLSCTSEEANLILNNDGLPAGVVLMPHGKTRLVGPAKMNGLLWSNSICAQQGEDAENGNPEVQQGSINLVTGIGEQSVMSRFRTLWAQNAFQFGRTAQRGIRGMDYDVFRRW